tara:strand:- start:1015 stop:1371 length:357 start_codon:yes stop_codon:yes gene_type:complete
MSLLKKLATENLTDPSNRLTDVELTKEEKLGLTEMFRSDSWEVLTTKVWPQFLKGIILTALTVQVDQRYFQGMFAGYKRLVDSANKYKNGFSDKVAEKLVPNPEDPTGYDMENQEFLH